MCTACWYYNASNVNHDVHHPWCRHLCMFTLIVHVVNGRQLDELVLCTLVYIIIINISIINNVHHPPGAAICACFMWHVHVLSVSVLDALVLSTLLFEV